MIASRTAGRTALALTLLFGAAANAAGQPVVSAIRVEEPPIIDGQLTDDAWRRAAWRTRSRRSGAGTGPASNSFPLPRCATASRPP